MVGGVVNVALVMDQVAAALDTIVGLRVFAYGAKSLPPPAAMVGWPDPYTYDSTMGRGSDSLTLPVYVVVGNVSAKTARDRLGAYADGSGTKSVKVAVEAFTYTACDTVRVKSCEFGTLTVAGTEFLAATFQIDVEGTGS